MSNHQDRYAGAAQSMKGDERIYRKRVRVAKMGTWLARRASRDTGPLDRICRRVLARLMRSSSKEDFMRDDWVESDVGFDPDELDRYQNGKSR